MSEKGLKDFKYFKSAESFLENDEVVEGDVCFVDLDTTQVVPGLKAESATTAFNIPTSDVGGNIWIS